MNSPAPTNVLALSYLFPNRAQPGYGVFVLHRLKAVQAHCRIKVVAPVQWYPFIHRLRGDFWSAEIPRKEEIQGLDTRHPRFAVIPRYFKWFDAISFWWAASRAERRLRSEEGFAFDLVDAHWTYPDVVAAYYLARSRGKKFAVTIRGHEALYLEENTIRRKLVAHFLRKADRVVALSEELKRCVIELGVDPERVRVVLNGVDISVFRSLDRAQCRRELDLPAGKRIALSVGRLTAGKGHQDLIRALPELLGRHDVHLYIIGGVNPEEDFQHVLRNLINELGLAERVHLLDGVPQDKLPLWYNAADLFCLATRREGCPNVVLEALACGAPVVVNDVGAVSEIVTPDRNGILVPPDQPAAWAEKLNRALTHEWDRAAIAQDMQRWGWARCAEQVRHIYDDLVGNAASPAHTSSRRALQ